MSITDELRDWAHEHLHKSGIRSDLLAIADRIDVVNEKAMSRAGQLLADVEKDRDYNYANWQECKQRVLQGNITFDELNARIECLEDELSHYVELPKDADGEYIHVGDMMERGKARGHVIALMLSEYPKKWGGGLHWGVQLEGEQAPTALDLTFHHYHKPTVKDVLRDVVTLCHNTWKEGSAFEFYDVDDVMESGNIAEYAAKLRLAGDAE